MKSLGSYLVLPRFLAMAALIALAVFATTRYSPHHASSNVFQTLYLHLIPVQLVDDPHAPVEAQRPLLSVPLDAVRAPAFFDMDLSQPGVQLVATNLQLFQLTAVLLIFVAFAGCARSIRTGRGDAFSKLLAGFAMYIRDEMVYPVMGRERGAKFVPYFLALFFFILFMNLLGLVPGGATATASIFVTAALATITLASMVICGMVAQGPIAFWKHLVPHVPAALWPLMFVVELIGLLVKPFALMIRLFANMNGGHMVVLSFMGLIFFFAQKGASLGYASAPVAVGFAVFIMIIEAFVALLQAYIFTQLSILFVGASVHPEH